MSVVLDDFGRAMVFDRVTGEVHRLSVPTAIENVARGQGRYVHGDKGERLDEDPAGEPEAAAEEAVIPLVQEGTLKLPEGEVGIGAAAPAPEAAPVPRPRPRPRPRAKK